MSSRLVAHPAETLILRISQVAATGIIAYLIWRLGWVSDDSLITLRHALNISHGYGPGFNATEAVQGFTSPLWFLLWLAVGVSTDSWIVGVIVLGTVLSTLTIFLILSNLKSITAVIIFSSAFGLSNAIMEYSTSGLENSLSFFSVTVAYLLFEQLAKKNSIKFAITAGLAVAAVVLTRFDLVLIIGMPAALTMWAIRVSKGKLAAFVFSAAVPVLVWLIGSYLAYGALLPNTFNAKRNAEIPAEELIQSGLFYIGQSISSDPVSGLLLYLGIVSGLVSRNTFHKFWAVGILTYLGYVVSNGGDFMAGRFLALPTLLAILLLASTWADSLRKVEIRNKSTAVVALGICVLLGQASGAVSLMSDVTKERWEWQSRGGLADERGYYVARFGFGITGNSALSNLQFRAATWPKREIGEDVSVPEDVGIACGGMGMHGLLTGPRKHWIDSCGLTDRFIASIPYVSRGNWRVGHLEREIPIGYEEAILNNNPDYVKDSDLRARLSELWKVIR